MQRRRGWHAAGDYQLHRERLLPLDGRDELEHGHLRRLARREQLLVAAAHAADEGERHRRGGAGHAGGCGGAELLHRVDHRLGGALEGLRRLLGRLVRHRLRGAVRLLGPLAEAAALLLDGEVELRQRGDRLDHSSRHVLQEVTELVDVDLPRVVGVVPLEDLLDRRVARLLLRRHTLFLTGQVGEVPIRRLVSTRVGRRRQLVLRLTPKLSPARHCLALSLAKERKAGIFE
mmetsp:Transcript_21566/g.54834  ORF Transcript_21566/g.54834 Transcript_21566/m.54834 type:complete len:232 (+) Transcript_21566:930-1625(+)